MQLNHSKACACAAWMMLHGRCRIPPPAPSPPIYRSPFLPQTLFLKEYVCAVAAAALQPYDRAPRSGGVALDQDAAVALANQVAENSIIRLCSCVTSVVGSRDRMQ
jgi:hypothetical protein